MTLPSVIRIFFAMELSGKAKESVSEFINLLKKKSKSHAIRWTRPENLHITLQFLAEMQRGDLAQLIERVRGLVQGKIQKIWLNFGELKLFPHPYRPRVIVLEVESQNELSALAGWIGQGIQSLNYAIEDRPFRPHLTLGRIKHLHGLNLNFLSDAAIEMPTLSAMEIQEVVLFQSDPYPEGSKYVVLEKIRFT